MIDTLRLKDALLHRFQTPRLLVVGDLMLDCYLFGTATRISPEAPVPVVRIERQARVLGGAGNVAMNLRGLGVQAELAGYVGNDAEAEILRHTCKQAQIGTEAVVAIDGFSTITKARILADDRQVVRFDQEIATPRDQTESDALIAAITRRLDAIPFSAILLSDYNKGVVTPYFSQALIKLAKERGIPVYVDPKGRDYDKYRGATCIKPNRAEMMEFAQSRGWTTLDPVEAAQQLQEALELDFVALTLGAQGIVLIESEKTTHLPTMAREVFDVSGAGDTVLAAMTAGLAAGLTREESVSLANLAAAQVVARVGTSPVNREELFLSLQAFGDRQGARKLYNLDDLKTVVDAWKAQGLKVAVTNGCFDLLHAGHVTLLEDSAKATDRLIVAINSDDSITRLKGPQRPIMPVEARSTVLSALECVDALVVFEEDTPLKVVETLRPDIIIKGGDYTVETVVGSDIVLSYGGEVKLIPLVPGVSTTRLAEAISKL